jgi:hypothetical protein
MRSGPTAQRSCGNDPAPGDLRSQGGWLPGCRVAGCRVAGCRVAGLPGCWLPSCRLSGARLPSFGTCTTTKDRRAKARRATWPRAPPGGNRSRQDKAAAKAAATTIQRPRSRARTDLDLVAAASAAALNSPQPDSPDRARGYFVPRAFAREFFAIFTFMGAATFMNRLSNGRADGTSSRDPPPDKSTRRALRNTPGGT